WQTFGWMPVGRRKRVFAFRLGQGAEQKATLHYGAGATVIEVDGRDLAFAYSANESGELDLNLDGVISRIVSVLDGHELYVRTRNGRFDLHWVDPFGGDDEEQAREDRVGVR